MPALARALAMAAFVVVIGSGAACSVDAASPSAPPTPIPLPLALPAAPSPAAPPIAATPTTTRSTTARPTTTTSRATRTAAECDEIASNSRRSNAELRPYLRSIGCDAAADGLLVGAADAEPPTPDQEDYLSDPLESACARGTASIEECFGPGADGDGNGAADINE